VRISSGKSIRTGVMSELNTLSITNVGGICDEAVRFTDELVAKLEDADFLRCLAEGKEENYRLFLLPGFAARPGGSVSFFRSNRRSAAARFKIPFSIAIARIVLSLLKASLAISAVRA